MSVALLCCLRKSSVDLGFEIVSLRGIWLASHKSHDLKADRGDLLSMEISVHKNHLLYDTLKNQLM